MNTGTPLDPIVPITSEQGTPSPTITTTLQYPWEHVVQAYNSRFPTHPAFPYLKDTVVPYHRTFPNSEEHMTRIVQLDMGFPGWLKKLTGAEHFTMREDVVINKREKKMTLRSGNITLFNSVRMYEECSYVQHPDNPDWTLKEQIAYLDLVYCRTHVCMGLKKSVEGFARHLFVSRAQGAAKDEVKLLAALPPSK